MNNQTFLVYLKCFFYKINMEFAHLSLFQKKSILYYVKKIIFLHTD